MTNQNVEVLPPEDAEQKQLGIVTTEEGSTVKLGRWKQATDDLAQLESKIENLHAQATALVVNDRESRERAGTYLAYVKADSKSAESATDPFESVIRRVGEFIRRKRQKVTNRAEEVRGILNRKMAEYDRLEEQRAASERQREQERITAESKRVADENARKEKEAAEERKKQRVAQAKRDLKDKKISQREYARILREAGDAEEAAKAEADAKAEETAKNPPKVEVKPDIPKQAGTRRLVKYHCECPNPEGFLFLLISSHSKNKELFLRLRECVVIDPSKLNVKANELIKKTPQDEDRQMTVEQFQARYPGVVVKEDRTY